MMRVGIVGGSGFTGGELLRLLLFHPDVEVVQVSSRSQARRPLHSVHPNLRGSSRLRFISPDDLQPCDALLLALPHGAAAADIERYAALAPRIVDLSADFRLDDAESWKRWYGDGHPAPDWLPRFVYGLPELRREQLRGARHVSGVGCNATAINLALWPLVEAGRLQRAAIEIKVGSSESGVRANAASHHPLRSGAVRTYSATGHRHMAEVEIVLGAELPLHFSVTAIEMVRGVHLLAHCELTDRHDEKEIWRLYRAACTDEPFLRLVRSRTGLHRVPEPRVVAGTNYCDVGFELDDDGRHLVVLAALDNLGKGAAGSAVQCLNLMFGLEETTGLTFPGYYP